MIVVTSLSLAPEQVRLRAAGHVVGILAPGTPHPEFPEIGKGNHLKLTFHDIAAPSPGLTAPLPEDAERLVEFLTRWDRRNPLLIHCWAGISRSTAAAFAALCIVRPGVSELDLARELRAASPSATPNPLIVSHIDALLGREGRMIAAAAAIGRGEDAYEGTPFALAIK